VQNMTAMNSGTGGSPAQTVQSYVKLDFAQVSLPDKRDSTLIHGKPKGWACAAAAA